jgi:hypothetical protein
MGLPLASALQRGFSNRLQHPRSPAEAGSINVLPASTPAEAGCKEEPAEAG